MAYCVHCGVKLSANAAACPLCGTVVYDPIAEKSIPEYAWPEQEDRFPSRRLNLPYLSKLMLLGLAAVIGVNVLCDLITTGSVSWSWYVIGISLFLAGISSALRFSQPWLKAVCVYSGMELMLLTIAWRNDGLRWFLLLALPFSSIMTAYVLICLRLALKKKLRVLHRIALCLACLVLSLILVEILTDQYLQNEIHLFWSIYAVIPLSVLALLLMLLSQNRHLLEEIRKNTFI